MKIISIAAAIILTTSVLAQNPISVFQIDVIPTLPTTFDTIKIATITKSPNFGESHGLSYVLSGDTIHVTGCYVGGLLTHPTVYYDTVTIGMLPLGNYHITFEARLTDTGECDGFYDSDFGQADFTVGFLSIGEQDGSLGISVFPNPSTHLQTLLVQGESDGEELRVDLYDMQGRFLRCVYKGNAKSISVDVSDLSSSMYFYRISWGDKNRTLRFVKQ